MKVLLELLSNLTYACKHLNGIQEVQMVRLGDFTRPELIQLRELKHMEDLVVFTFMVDGLKDLQGVLI